MNTSAVSLSRRRHPGIGLVLVAALALPACASPGTYPSLARRDAERVSGSALPDAPEAPAPMPVPPTAGLPDRLDALVGQARDAHRRFMGARPGTDSLVARAAGSAIAGESWSAATVALAGLEASRSQAMIALAELDSLLAADAVAHFDSASGDAQAIASARDQVIALIGEQDAVLAALRARLPG